MVGRNEWSCWTLSKDDIDHVSLTLGVIHESFTGDDYENIARKFIKGFGWANEGWEAILKEAINLHMAEKNTEKKEQVITMPKRITSLDELKREAQGEQDVVFFILLTGNLRSSKRIVWDEEDKRFYIFNYLDDTEQTLTEAQLMDRDYTNIGYAMTRWALFKDD